MVTPVGVQTPSTSPRASRFRPFPSSPSSPSAAIDAPSHDNNHYGLSNEQLREIKTVFQIFDPDLSMHIDVPTFEVMARSLGFRMTQVEIRGMVEMLWEERQEQQTANNNNNTTTTIPYENDERGQMIDLPMTIQILAKRGYANRSTEDEMQMYFRIFDHGNKGCITLEDLRRVQSEVIQAQQEMLDIGSSGSGMDVGMVGDATLKAMIDQFDTNQDGVLDYEEFRKIMEPVLSESSA